jgi:hypothetical protein
LQIGIAATALPLATQAALAAAAPVGGAANVVPLYKVLYDVRFADSVAFARRAETRGVATHAIEGDMTRFWYDDLYHRWRREPAAIAGLTAHGPLFCLERLAWDQGMRVVFRAEHSAAADCLEHRVAGPVAMLADARRAVGDGAWATRLADVVMTCPSGRAEIGELATRGPSGLAPRDGDALFSWVIAPAIRS